MDLRITSDGVLDFSTGDIAQTTTAEDISQKLYRALLAMPSHLISGQAGLGYAELQTSVKAFLMNYFANDKLVNPALIAVSLASAQDGDAVSISLTYKDPSANGNAVETSSGMSYTLSDGTVTGVSFTSDTLSAFEAPATVPVQMPLVLTEPTTVIQIPIQPGIDPETGTVCIFAREETDTSNIARTLIPFTIHTADRKKTYTLANYVTQPMPAGSSVYSVAVTDATVDYSILSAFGAFSLSANTEGMINGTLTVFNCPYLASIFEVYDTHIESPAFPLSPLRGKYRVIFTKPIPRGRYVIQYTGIIPG